MNRVTIIVSGYVQGVFFRASTRAQAHKLGIVGYVQNLSDGKVEIVGEGKREALEKLVQWCTQGPFFAKVKKADVIWENTTGTFNDFSIR